MGLKYHGAPQVCDFLTWGIALTALLHAGFPKSQLPSDSSVTVNTSED